MALTVTDECEWCGNPTTTCVVEFCGMTRDACTVCAVALVDGVFRPPPDRDITSARLQWEATIQYPIDP